MEGVKILSEEMIKNFGGDTLFPFLILLGAVVLVSSVVLLLFLKLSAKSLFLFTIILPHSLIKLSSAIFQALPTQIVTLNKSLQYLEELCQLDQ